MVDTRSNMQLADLKSKPHGGKILRDIIERTTGDFFYPFQGSEHYNLIRLNMFHGSTHINDKHRKNDETKIT